MPISAFVLTAGGHNVGIVNPPGQARSSYRLREWHAGNRLLTPDEWLQDTPAIAGSWWTAWTAWLAGHSAVRVRTTTARRARRGAAAAAGGTGSVRAPALSRPAHGCGTPAAPIARGHDGEVPGQSCYARARRKNPGLPTHPFDPIQPRVSPDLHIAVLDDEIDITQLLASYLQGHGYRVTQLHGGQALMQIMHTDPPALVLLDLGLPGEDGLTIARQLREHWQCGLVIVSGRGDAVDKVVGLEIGADDYVTKPFDLRELLARIKAVLRRMAPPPVPGPGSPAAGARSRLRFDGWLLDTAARRLTNAQGQDVALTSGEFDLLCTFALHAGTGVVARLPARPDTRPRGGAVRSHHRRAGRPPAQEARTRCRRSADHQVGTRRGLHPGATGRGRVTPWPTQ